METTTAHSHGGSGEGPCANAGMKMYFHAGLCETVLFKEWQIVNEETMAISAAGILILALLYECLKHYREYLYTKKLNEDKIKTPRETDSLTPKKTNFREHMFSGMHALQTLLQAVQMLLSYFLMLIFMTYNVYLCAAIIIGCTLGYFLMGWRKSAIVDVAEHCH